MLALNRLLHIKSIHLHPSYSSIVKKKIIPLTEIIAPTDVQVIVFDCAQDYGIDDYLMLAKHYKIIKGEQNENYN